MSKPKKRTATLEKKREEQPVVGIPDSWPAAERAAPQPEAAKKDSPLNRLSFRIHTLAVRVLSNLRLSLTLRIALHYAGQLLRSTLTVLLVGMLALCVAQVPTVNKALDELNLMTPQDGKSYTVEQLRGLPVLEAYLSDERIDNGLADWGRKIRLFFSDFRRDGHYRAMIYANTAQGGLVAAFSLDQLLYTGSILFWTLLCCDLFRVANFLKHRNRLNRKVLKPVTAMAETAAKLSANNLSDRISVDGTKNELKDLAMVINGMLDRIELSYNSQKQFVSDASHELRTPIAVIQGYAGMLERWGKTDKEVLDEGITAISQEAASMKELVERLLFLARHDKKTLLLEMEDFDPLEVMSEVSREAKLLSPAHSFALSPAQNARISGDKGMVKQLMRILVDNAIKYTPPGGSITLGVRCDSRSCSLSVTDTGAGISAENLPKVFDRFYRCDDARKSQTSGHGLGLSIARIIVVAHGGKLKVRSKVGVGTTFCAIFQLVE
ncbi:MAG: HAMP domain-containing sensor histidine kinase [Clostridia bacterium]